MSAQGANAVDFAGLAAKAEVSLQKRFERHLESIEETHRSGVPHQKIVELLNANGFELSLQTYHAMLQRARKRRNKKASAAPLALQKVAHKPLSTGRGVIPVVTAAAAAPILPAPKEPAKTLQHDLTTVSQW
ncbi:hypothetical protein [Pseudoduganella sp. R-34]|uniref:hypothetical protein n=1 Tax=Pseudoduganella sp. R-34 TaxID=3404062 RepID=UPI003CEFA018